MYPKQRRSPRKTLALLPTPECPGPSRLVELARESLETTYPKSEIDRAMDPVFQSPGALRSVPTFLCAGCRKTMPCRGAPSPCLRPSIGGLSHGEAILVFVA